MRCRVSTVAIGFTAFFVAHAASAETLDLGGLWEGTIKCRHLGEGVHSTRTAKQPILLDEFGDRLGMDAGSRGHYNGVVFPGTREQHGEFIIARGEGCSSSETGRMRVTLDGDQGRFEGTSIAFSDSRAAMPEREICRWRYKRTVRADLPELSTCLLPEGRLAVTVAIATAGVPLTGIHLEIRYPSSVKLPGFGNSDSVRERVMFLVTGLTQVNDHDSDFDFDFVEDTLGLSVINLDLFSEGSFAVVEFDVDGLPPTAEEFACTVVGAADVDGKDVPATCSLSVAP